MQVVIATWSLVAIGAVTAAFICWQAWESRKAAKAASDSVKAFQTQAAIMDRQTTATQSAAEAAQASANAVVSIERPWILLDKIGTLILDPGESHDAIPRPRQCFCSFTVRNFGRTPAKVTHERAELRVGSHPTIPPFDTFRFEGSSVTPHMLPQGEHLDGFATLQPFGFISQDEWQEFLAAGSKFLWLCVTFRYRDTFERGNISDYETRFSYRYDPWIKPPQVPWLLVGPEQCNRAT